MSDEQKASLLGRADRFVQRWVSTVLRETQRTRRVISAPERAAGGEPPIFVVGVHRSGTTLLRLILDSHSRIACPPESFFVAPLSSLLDDSKAMEGLEAMGFDEDHVLGQIREAAAYFFETYAASHGKVRWADKTPSYVNCLDTLERVFGPECRYLLLFRHGLDAACSIAEMPNRDLDPYIEACKGDTHAAAARYWSVQCQKMLDFEAKHPDRCFEIRYEDLASEPEDRIPKIFEFVGEAWEPEVLRFHEKKHDTWMGLQDEKAARSKGFEPNTERWRAQPPEIVARMLEEAGPMLERLGYRADPEPASR